MSNALQIDSNKWLTGAVQTKDWAVPRFQPLQSMVMYLPQSVIMSICQQVY